MKRGIEIGNYVLAERLDQGGTGQVWLAYRELAAGGRTAVAIKLPHAAGTIDDRVRDGLDDEARLQMQLQHSNIPRVIDLGVHEGLPYFVMDYIAGRSLAQLLARLRELGTPMQFELVAHIAREIGYALQFAHGFELDGVSRPVLHRDVAPRNVLLSKQGAVYVVDFGVSEAAGIHSANKAVKGTLVYMAPEHALGFPTPQSDGWGLGAILWEMIEGRPFREEVEADELHRAAKQGRHGPLTREGIPEVLRLVTEGLLQADDGERLTLDEALRQLEAPDLPVQRMGLADVLARCFGEALQRPGRSLAEEEEAPEPPARPPAVAKGIRDEGPFGLDTWRVDPEEDDAALPPPPAWASMEGPVEEAADEPALPPGEAHGSADEPASEDEPAADEPAADEPAADEPAADEPAADEPAADEPAADGEASEPRAPEETRRPEPDAVAEPPLLAVLDLGESSSAVATKPAVSPPLETPAPPPAATPRPGRSRAVLPVLGLALVGGVVWAVWLRGTDSDPKPMPSPAIPVSKVQPAEGPVVPEPTPAVVPEPTPPVVPEPASSEVGSTTSDAAAEPTDGEPTDGEPTDGEPTDGEPTDGEPTDGEPTDGEPTDTPEPEPSADRDPPSSSKAKAGSKAPRSKKKGPPVPLAITLRLFADMELEINGVHFSLGVRRTAAKTTVAPGKVRMRWRRPLGKWKSKSFQVQAGKRYEVLLDDRGVTLRPS